MTRQARSDSTRGRVLDGALELFGETSSVEVPVRLLSARSGVSVGSIYHHFGDMAGVSAALYSRCMCALLDHMLASVPAGGRLEALVGSTVRSYLGWTRRNILEARFIHASAFAPFAAAYREDIRKEKAGRMERLAAALAAHTRSGGARALPFFVLEMLVIGPVAETARRWLSGSPDADLDAAERHLPGRILRSVRSGR